MPFSFCRMVGTGPPCPSPPFFIPSLLKVRISVNRLFSDLYLVFVNNRLFFSVQGRVPFYIAFSRLNVGVRAVRPASCSWVFGFSGAESTAVLTERHTPLHFFAPPLPELFPRPFPCPPTPAGIQTPTIPSNLSSPCPPSCKCLLPIVSQSFRYPLPLHVHVTSPSPSSPRSQRLRDHLTPNKQTPHSNPFHLSRLFHADPPRKVFVPIHLFFFYFPSSLSPRPHHSSPGN